jgi:hypothetical protein
MEYRCTFEGRARLDVGTGIGRLEGRSALEKELVTVIKLLGRNPSRACLVDIASNVGARRHVDAKRPRASTAHQNLH